MASEIINVCLTVGDFKDEEYCKHAAVTMLSILDSTQSQVKFYLVAGNETKPSEKIKNLFEHIGDVEYGYINIDEKLPETLYSFKTFTKYSALRLFLPELYPNIHKMLYFDCDIVCNGVDIKELWNTPVETIGAVTEGCYKNRCGGYAYRQIKKLGINLKNYFNTGVLIMNLDNLRDLPLNLSKNIKLVEKCSYLDQDTLNYFYPNAVRLPEKYNYILYYHQGENSDNKIIHFATWLKPYKAYFQSESTLYWKYRCLIEDEKTIIEKTLILPNVSKTGLDSLAKNLTSIGHLRHLIFRIAKYKTRPFLRRKFGLK